MKILNALGLPEPIVRAVTNDDYQRGDRTRRLSVSELIAPPRVVALQRLHWDEIEEDVSDRIWALLGQAVHEILRRADMEALTEQKLTMPVAGWTISGQFDRLAYTPAGLLQDYKVTSVWSVKDGAKADWIAQLNIYAALIRHAGHPVTRAEAVVFLRDWRKNEALRYPDYPPRQVTVIPVELWSPEQTQRYLEERVALHAAAEAVLPDCTDEERWRRPVKFAVMKEKQKRAVRVFDEKGAALVFIGADPKLTLVERPGELVRCAQYCSVARKCTQYAAAQAAETPNEEE